MKIETARFWIQYKESFVKITLRSDSEIAFRSFSATTSFWNDLRVWYWIKDSVVFKNIVNEGHDHLGYHNTQSLEYVEIRHLPKPPHRNQFLRNASGKQVPSLPLWKEYPKEETLIG